MRNYYHGFSESLLQRLNTTFNLHVTNESLTYGIALFFTVCLLCFGLYLLRRSIAYELNLSNTPICKISASSEGYAHIMGVQMNLKGEKLLTKLAQQPCTWYRYKIFQFDNDINTPLLFEQGESDYFIRLIDTTGECVINPNGAKMIGYKRLEWYANTSTHITPPKSVILKNKAWLNFNLLKYIPYFNEIVSGKQNSYLFIEEYFVPTTRLMALGKLTTIHVETGEKTRLLGADSTGNRPFILAQKENQTLIVNQKMMIGLSLFFILLSSYLLCFYFF